MHHLKPGDFGNVTCGTKMLPIKRRLAIKSHAPQLDLCAHIILRIKHNCSLHSNFVHNVHVTPEILYLVYYCLGK